MECLRCICNKERLQFASIYVLPLFQSTDSEIIAPFQNRTNNFRNNSPQMFFYKTALKAAMTTAKFELN